MSMLKRCSGTKGRWECVDKYPDHMVPVSEFNKDRYSKDGMHHYCKRCHRYESSEIHYANRPKHPVTGQWKHNWKDVYARSLGGKAGTSEWQSLLDKAEVVWNDEIQEIEAKAWLGTIFPRPPKDNLPAAKPARKRVSTTYDRLLPKEGWVYIMDTYRYNKIGKTWEDGLRARRSEARRWGPADLVYWAWFDDAMAAEKEIHRRLKRYRVEKENVGEELFNCPVSIARDEIKKLQKELEDDTRKEQKVG